MTRRYIHVGSWNIEHFSKRGGREENIYALAEHIEMASLDVLALQEVYVTHMNGDARRNEHIDGVLRLLKEHTGDEWDYEIFENRQADDEEQLCAITWNTSVLTKVATFRIPVKTRHGNLSLWDRTPHAVKFRHENRTDFVVIPLHMKSNYGGATKAKRVRHREAETLIDNLEKVRQELDDLDIILIGDTNCLGSDERALRLITESGFEDLNEADTRTFVSGAPFDRIFIPEDRKVFRYSRQYIMVAANPDDHDRYLSDHYLAKTVLKILRDDDGSA